MAVVSISVPDDLVDDMDASIASGAYRGRSEWMRAASRHYLQHGAADAMDGGADAGRHVHGSLTLVYQEGHEARISDVRHAFHDVVLSMMHTHCEPEVCMDVLIIGGPGHRITALRQAVDRMREVKRAVLVPAPA